MSRSRHAPSATEPSVRSLALDLASGYEVEGHAHDWSQVLHAASGVLSVQTPRGSWVVPPGRGVWISARSPHAVSCIGPVRLRTLYIADAPRPRDEQPCRVIVVGPLLRALIDDVVSRGFLRPDRPQHERLRGVLLDQLDAAANVPFDLPEPRDERARHVARIVRLDPGSSRPLSTIARESGASPRTIERLFARETGLSFGRWRRQARLVYAAGLLAEGESVTRVALLAGYDGTSAFVAMFRRELGVTPGRYAARIRAE